MSATLLDATHNIPAEVLDAARASVENSLASILGQKPTRQPDTTSSDAPAILGIISFVGDSKWSLALQLTDPTASRMVEKFCGLALPFDSPDMGDAAGELVNVIAGEVIAQMEKRRQKVRMSLPIVIRGSAMELFADRGTATEVIGYESAFGPFVVRVTAVGGSVIQRMFT